jgi:hypothetical protein
MERSLFNILLIPQNLLLPVLCSGSLARIFRCQGFGTFRLYEVVGSQDDWLFLLQVRNLEFLGGR